MPVSEERAKGIAELRRYWEKGGYRRREPNRKLRSPKLPPSHHGYELRFSASSREEALAIARLLRATGFRPGKPWLKPKARQWRVPVYGRAQVAELLMHFGS
jgi:hypothetical protein